MPSWDSWATWETTSLREASSREVIGVLFGGAGSEIPLAWSTKRGIRKTELA